ncbi:MAG: flippase-like domain-containing protein [Alphaproteobacteria bacterium]|nr:flippase-like domain-containing protein [Alphaproteobacteria bacterium]
MPNQADQPAASDRFQTDDARRGLSRGLWTIGGLCLAIGAAIAALLQTDVGAATVLDLVARAQPGRLALSMAVMTLAFLCMALRWRSLMPAGHHPPAGGLMAIVLAGLLLNYALPGPLGELGAAWFASRRYGVPLAMSMASGFAARLMGLAVAALTAAVVFLTVDLAVPEGYDRLVAAAVLLIGVAGVGLLVLAAFPEPLRRLGHLLVAPLTRAPGIVGSLALRVQGAIDAVARDLALVARSGPAAWGGAALWTLASHTSVIGGVLIAISAFQAPADLAGVVFTYATTTAGAVALFALPGSQLGWDAMFLGLLAGPGAMNVGDASAVALTVRVHHLAVMLLGAFALVWLLRTGTTQAGRDGDG